MYSEPDAMNRQTVEGNNSRNSGCFSLAERQSPYQVEQLQVNELGGFGESR